MARLQLLIPLIIWATWLAYRTPALVPWAWGAAIYGLSLALVVVGMRRMARRAMNRTTIRSVRATAVFHQIMFTARWLVIVIHAVALFVLGWGEVVLATGVTSHGAWESLGALLSIVPVALAWIGLAWAQYPLERAVREQNVLSAFNLGEAYFDPPTIGQYVANATRLQVFSLLAPVACAILLRDLLLVIAHTRGVDRTNESEALSMLASAMVIFLVGPEILRAVLPVRRLPDGPLRTRLEAMCERLGMSYRQILLWDTHHTLCNAMVMGLIPQFRYILLSDLLIRTMDERQIEAVFAHEAGHVKHRHLTWFVVFAIVFLLWLDEAHSLLTSALDDSRFFQHLPVEAIMACVGVTGFFVIFGLLSRSFERQADLFAARNVIAPGDEVRVDPEGVAVFNSALQQVAQINNMPIDAEPFVARGGWFRRWFGALAHHAANWRHGSIRARMEYLQSLPANPRRTEQFDRRMTVLRIALLIALCSTAGWVITSLAR